MINIDLRDKTAIVTGGASGIGKAIAFELARNGCNIVIGDINVKGAQDLLPECKKYGVEAVAVETDVSKSVDVKKLFRETLKISNEIDILINNAGAVQTSGVEDTDEETWDKMMAINLKGTFLCCNEAIKIMKKQAYGKIVNMGSISGKVGGIHSGSAYSASKAGIICYTKSLAKALSAYSINVNCIAPGLVDTPMTKDYPESMIDMIPLRRRGMPEEIAYLALFLVSEASAYITGETININGGLLMD
jgi:NAD(P)-dependent dehydrogenase (short-subunit alcohol dehydrogenase family)